MSDDKTTEDLKKLGLLDDDIYSELMSREAEIAVPSNSVGQERSWRLIESQINPNRKSLRPATQSPWSFGVALPAVAAVLILSLGIWISNIDSSSSPDGVKGESPMTIPATLEVLQLGTGSPVKIDASTPVAPGSSLIFRVHAPQSAVAALVLEQAPGEWVLVHPGMKLTAGEAVEFGTREGTTGWTVQKNEAGSGRLRFCVVAVEATSSIRDLTDDIAANQKLPLVHDCVLLNVGP